MTTFRVLRVFRGQDRVEVGTIHHQAVSNAIGPWLAPFGVSE